MSSGIIKAQPSVEQIKAAVEEQTRLANAAPEMFEALVEIETWLRASKTAFPHDAVELALKKARGK